MASNSVILTGSGVVPIPISVPINSQIWSDLLFVATNSVILTGSGVVPINPSVTA